MTKQFYIQVEKDTNKVTDIIEYPHEGYEPISLETPLPPQILGGAYERVGDSVVYRKEWDKSEDKQKIADLEATVLTLMDVITGGGTNV